MSGLSANTGGMNENGRTTVSNAGYLQTELTSLARNVESLMGIWKGASASAFNQSFQEQSRNFEAFRLLLNDLGEAVTKAADILNRTEEENASAGARLFG